MTIEPLTTIDIDITREEKQYGDLSLTIGKTTTAGLAAVADDLLKHKEEAQSRTLEQNITVMDRVCKIWLDKNSPMRKEALMVLPAVLGQSKQIVEKDIDLASQFFAREYLERLLRFEIGNKDRGIGKEYIDGWIDEGLFYTHYHPRPGIIFHSLSGNALIVNLLSISFGLLTKKVNIFKLPGNEPYFAHAIVRTLFSIDPSLKKIMSVVYWSSKEKDMYDAIFAKMKDQYVIQWGTAEATFAIQNYCKKYEVKKLVSHGPKVSFEVLENVNTYNYVKLAGDIIENDVLYWEQSACTSARFIFVKNSDRNISIEKFAEQLGISFRELGCKLPKTAFLKEEQENSHISDKYVKKYEDMEAGKIFSADNREWVVIYSNTMPGIRDITLCYGRVLFVAPVNDIYEVVEFVDNHKLSYFIQTLGYDGEDLNFCREMGKRGTALITYPGDLNYHMAGTSHDGLYNLKELMDVIIICRQKKVDLMQDSLLALKRIKK
ncbi:MAG: hypothetical protein JXB88_18155 [Spirochaetales bacterium]|nr:hypothetical protein [Spirochaetales bacterium]